MATGLTIGIAPSGAYNASKTWGPFGTSDPYTEAAFFLVNVSSVAGSGMTVKIQGVDQTSNMGYDLLTSSFINTAGTTLLRIGPAYTAGANIAKDYMPSNFQVITTISGGVVNYSIGAEFI